MADGAVAYAVHSFPPPSNGEKPEAESAALMPSEELRKKKRVKCVLFGAAFAVFQTAIILVFVLLIMKYKAPKFRLRSVTLHDLNVVAAPSNASFDARLNVQLGVKNSNFGPYKYGESKVELFYGDFVVGEGVVPGSKAGLKSTKKVEVVDVRVSSENVTDVKRLGSELSSGMLRLNVRSKLEGKVTLMFVMKKRKTSEMDCILAIHLDKKKTLQDITCK